MAHFPTPKKGTGIKNKIVEKSFALIKNVLSLIYQKRKTMHPLVKIIFFAAFGSFVVTLLLCLAFSGNIIEAYCSPLPYFFFVVFYIGGAIDAGNS